MSYWRLNLRSMTNGLPKHWSISLIWSLITNNTLVPPVPPTKGLPITMYPRAGVPSLPSFCPWVTGYNTSHSEHPSDVLLIATAPTLAQHVFIVSLGLLLLSPQTCDLPLCLLDGFRAIFMNFMPFHFSVCIYMPTLHTDQVFQPEISFYRAVFKAPQCEPDSTSVLLTVPACISPPLNLFLTSLAFAHGDPNSSHFIPLAFSAHLPGRNFFSCESWHHLTGPEWVA